MAARSERRTVGRAGGQQWTWLRSGVWLRARCSGAERTFRWLGRLVPAGGAHNSLAI